MAGHPGRPRVVITGMGLVCPLGCGAELAWRRLLEGRSGLRRLPDAVVEGLDAAVGGTVPTPAEDAEGGWEPGVTASAKDLRKMDRFIPMALEAARQALAQAAWAPADPRSRERTATVIASGIGGFGAIAEAVRTTDGRGPQRLSPFTVPSFLVNLAAGHVSIRHGFQGPLGAPVTACAAGVQALGDGARMIRAGEADVAVCGGTEAAIDRVSLGGFAAAKALSTAFADRPDQASRPFDAARDGFVMGEGAGVLVLESLDHALARGAVPLAEVVGYGTSADAHHITSGPEDGDGARRAMALALAQAGLAPEQVQYLNAHATSTYVGDRGELAAVRSLFGLGGTVAISSTKAATGHLLGAAGAVAAIFTALALRDQVVPATRNLVQPDALAEGLDLVAGSARPMLLQHALVNGFGFGGVNASLVLGRWAPGDS
ncbi:beta-ketoacyl-[acyl-carrier-protein] synthase II [Paracidovorax avenae]|uniref:beta-ketoacyl-ACP synthase II n=1 Tax=Paracidovorax avenae TaxID=80867 RepID=UPI000D2011C3|nr:beta-ketoacyl-ACP synthase II [Paracidovorax avenae]AVS68605.1 beta-ketoacyl-[acyl-carrier-protein] synthase II [Paracidovorax avenae]